MATLGEKSCTVDDQFQEQTQVELVVASEVDIPQPCTQIERSQAKRASRKGNESCGYECEVVQPPPEALQTDCPICLMVLRKPHIISCCGQSFCLTCIDRIKTGGKSCPLCNATDFSIIHNRGLENMLKEFEVRCTYASSGCEWVGKLGLLDDHLNLNSDDEKQLEGCDFVEIACNHKCGDVFSRCTLANHQGEECPKRPYSCDYCRDFASTFEDVANNHWPVCKCYPLSCPNQCTPYAFERQHFEDHLSNDCPLTIVNCDFQYAGCEVQLPRKDMPAHLRENFTHVSLLAAMNQKLAEKLLKKDEEISKLSQELKETVARLDKKEKEQLEKENTELKSELTKKHDESVHELHTTLRQEIDKNREEKAAMKQEIQLEFDQLKKKQATDIHSLTQDMTDLRKKQQQDRIELETVHEQRLKQQASSVQGLSTTLRQEADRSRRERATLKQELQVKMNQLRQNQATDTKRLTQGMSDMREKQERDGMELERQATTLELVDARIRSAPFQFTMPDFEKHKAADDEWYSEPFYTHPEGYKMCLCVYANGYATARQSHISVFAFLMRGMFDEHLKWPLACYITIELLNQKENEGHRKVVFHFGNSANVTTTNRVTEGERAECGWGKPAFISHAELYLRRDDFINNGCIRFQITKFELRT